MMRPAARGSFGSLGSSRGMFRRFSSFSNSVSSTLTHTVDGYGGVTVQDTAIPDTKEEFSALIRHSLETWKEEGRRGVWLKIPASKIDYTGN